MFIGVLLRNWQMVLLLVLLFVEGIFYTQGETYYWWYLLEELGADIVMIYIFQFTGVVLEVCYFISYYCTYGRIWLRLTTRF